MTTGWDGLPGLAGRHALITGASRGVGRATALLLSRSGCRVGIAYRSRKEDALRVVDEVESEGGEAWAFGSDLASPDGVEALFREMERHWNRVDIFVGNHGSWPPSPVALADLTPERWQRTLRENLDSMFHCLRWALPAMSDHGSVVLVSSTAAQRGEAFHADYAAAKGALVSLVKSLCVETAPRGIRVNGVAPGWIDTEMAAPALHGPDRAAVVEGIPLRRIATADDVAGPIAFLCSSLARHVTGEVLNVNGGSVLPG